MSKQNRRCRRSEAASVSENPLKVLNLIVFLEGAEQNSGVEGGRRRRWRRTWVSDEIGRRIQTDDELDVKINPDAPVALPVSPASGNPLPGLSIHSAALKVGE